MNAHEGAFLVTARPARQHRQLLWAFIGVQWFVSGLLSFLMADQVGWPEVAGWIAVFWTILLARTFSMARSRPPMEPVREGGQIRSALLVCGAWGGSSLLLLSGHPEVGMAALIQLYVLAGVAAAGGIVYAHNFRVAATAILATLLPLAVVHLVLGGALHLTIAIGSFLYAGTLLLASAHLGRIIDRAARADAENQELAGRLAAEARQRNEEATRALRREQEQEAEHHARYWHLFANFRDPIMMLDLIDGEFLFVASLNPAAEDLLGIDQADARGRQLAGLVSEAFTHRLAGAVAECVTTGAAVRYELETSNPAELRNYDVTIIAMRNREGQISRVAVICKDISERKQAERRLEETRRHLLSVMRTIPDLLFLKDLRGAFLAVNPEFTRRLGMAESQVLGKTDFELWGPELGAAFHARDQAAIRAGDICINEEWVTFADGARVLLETRKVPVFGEDGEVTGLLGVARDVTERRRIESELLRSRDFLQAVIDGISDAVIVKDRAHRWLLVNRALCQWLGRPREELIGKTDRDYMPEEQARLYWSVDDLVFNGQGEQINEEPVTGADGTTRHVQTKKQRVTGPAGEELLVAVIRDISERRRMEERLAEREGELRSLVENMPDPVVRYDRDCRRIFVTPGIAKSTALPAESLIGKRPVEAWGNASLSAEEFEAELRRVIDTGRPGEVLLRFLLPGGREHSELIRLVPEHDETGAIRSVLAVARDVTELRRAQSLLHAREEAFRSLAENSPDTIVRYDRDQRRLYVNPAFVLQAGVPAEALLANVPAQSTGDEMSAEYLEAIQEVFRTGNERGIEIHWTTLDGTARCSHVRIVPERNREGRIASVLAIGRDISEIDDYRRRILSLAFYDPMTGLANRALFGDRLQQIVSTPDRLHHLTGVVLIDLDGFKTINDSLGHAAGDALLRHTAARLAGAVRGYDTVARLGGDEFAILLPELRSAADAGKVAHKILDAFEEAFEIEGRELFVTASVGIALFPTDGTTADEMLKYADSAMYHAKARGRNTFQFYRAEMTRRAEERLHVEASLRKALANGELSLHYQPQFRLEGRRLHGAEALLRWDSPLLGRVTPDRFIPIAEETGLIVEIGAWVLEEAARTAAAWNHAGRPLRVAVNVSTRQFRSQNFAALVLAALGRAACRPEWIELEITESLLLEHNSEVITTMEALRAEGITFAVDDFGTGYSALGYLQRFPIDVVKIDRSFVHGITSDGHAADLVRAIIAMTEVLNLSIVAEGVETEVQSERLQGWGKGLYAQGYLFGRPMAREEFERTLFASPAGAGGDQ